MKKYLFISYEGHPSGGSEFLWRAAAERLARHGNQVRVSTKDWGTPFPQIESLRSAGCEVLYRPPAIPPFLRRQMNRVMHQPPYHEAHLRRIAKGVDLVVISQGANFDGQPWMEAALASGHRYTVISQSANEQWWLRDNEAERLKRCYEGACAAFFVSEANLALTRMQFDTPLPHGRVVRNPFNVRYHAQSPWPRGSGDGLLLACVARLAAFRECGVNDVMGFDGEYVNRARLLIPQSCFQAADLSKPLAVSRTFDLAVSLEVAEHLPPECAPTFVASLVRLAPVILFSAATPFQGGTHHVNERWPKVWANTFREHGYVAIDCIRRRVWEDDAVEFTYAQNTVVFARAEALRDNALLRAEFERSDPEPLSLVHPTLYLNRVNPTLGLAEACRIFWHCFKNSVRYRLFGLPPRDFLGRNN